MARPRNHGNMAGNPARKVRAEPMTDVQFTAAITHERRLDVARCLQVEVTSQGELVESALADVREALELYFEDEPLPADVQLPIIAPIEISVRAARVPIRPSGGRGGACSLERAGFVSRSQRGSHRKLRHPDGRTAIVPMHREVARGTALDPEAGRLE